MFFWCGYTLQSPKLFCQCHTTKEANRYLKQVPPIFNFDELKTSLMLKLKNPRSSLPLKRFIAYFLTTWNPRKAKVR